VLVPHQADTRPQIDGQPSREAAEALLDRAFAARREEATFEAGHQRQLDLRRIKTQAGLGSCLGQRDSAADGSSTWTVHEHRSWRSIADAQRDPHVPGITRAAERIGLKVGGGPRVREFSGARNGVVFEIEQIRTVMWSPRYGTPSVAPSYSCKVRVRSQKSVDWLDLYRPIRLDASNLEAEIASLVERGQRGRTS